MEYGGVHDTECRRVAETTDVASEIKKKYMDKFLSIHGFLPIGSRQIDVLIQTIAEYL